MGTWDSSRFPLIKPYDAVYVNDRDGWMINLPFIPGEPDLYGSASRVQKIFVIDGVILAYTPYKPSFSSRIPEITEYYYWFVMIPDKEIHRGFSAEADFLAFIKDLGIDSISWKNPDDLFQRFYNTGCLEWIPGCEQ
jgi:hypothetical protein